MKAFFQHRLQVVGGCDVPLASDSSDHRLLAKNAKSSRLVSIDASTAHACHAPEVNPSLGYVLLVMALGLSTLVASPCVAGNYL